MASTAAALYLPEAPVGQGLTFDERVCEDYCLVIGNSPACNENPITNHLFQGTITPLWTIVGAGTSQTGSNPCTVTGNVSIDLQQTVTMEDGLWTLFYSFSNSDTTAWSGDVLITAGLVVTSLWAASVQQHQTGFQNFTLTVGGSPVFEMQFTVATNTKVITCNYAFLCRTTPFMLQNDYCIQLPLFETGTEKLALTDEEVGLAYDFTYAVPANDVTSGSSGAASLVHKFIAHSIATLTSGAGEYFNELKMSAVQVTWGTGPTNGISKYIDISLEDHPGNTLIDNIPTNAGDSDTDRLTLGTQTWVGTEVIDLLIHTIEEADLATPGVFRHDWDIFFDEISMIPNFFSTTFVGLDNTFYRITFRLNKTATASVRISDSAPVVIFAAAADGVELDMIFQTGVLPGGKVVTVRFEVQDIIGYDTDPDWNSAVLTNVQVWEMCKWNVRVDTLAEVFVSNLTETHDTTMQTTGLEYHQNIEYCLDVNTLAPGCYKFLAIDDCEATNAYYSNCYTVCTQMKTLSEISWTPGRAICSGGEVLDYVAYPRTLYFWVQASLQDLTVEEENKFYRKSDGNWEKPWTYQSSMEVLQVWPMPPFMRQVMALAMSGTFSVNGVAYQKLNDDDYAPQFNATYQSPMRILVSKVGDFIISRE